MNLRAAAVVIAIAVAGAGTLALAAGGGDEAPLPAGPLRIATGSRDGVYYAYGLGLARLLRRDEPALQPLVVSTDASIENLRLLAARRAEVAFVLADSAADAARGTGRFDHPLPLAALARLYDNYVQIVVPARSPIRSVADLAGHRVSVGAPGSGTRLTAQRILAVAHLGGRRRVHATALGLTASAAALAAGRIDAFFFSGGLPTPAISRLRERMPIRLASLGGVAARLSARYGDLYTETRVPRAVYGPPSAVTTVSVPNYLVVRADMDDEVAYRLTRLLFRRQGDLERAHPEAARLNLRAAIATRPLPLHPGAARWYRQAHR